MANNKRPKKETADDILGMIRARQKDSTKLKKFLDGLDEDQSYKETDLYQLGLEDGQDMGKDLADQRHRQELVAIRTMIDALIASK
jgi:predicted transposase YdaD